jgi:hypothetical protein
MRERWQQFWARSWWFKGPILGGIAFVALIAFGAAVGSGSNNSDTAVLGATPTPLATQTFHATASATASPLVTSTPTATPKPTLAPTPVPTPYVAPATPYVAPVTPYVPPVVTQAPYNPYAGATAICSDGTLSFSAHRSGTCSHHGGVAEWCPCNVP